MADSNTECLVKTILFFDIFSSIANHRYFLFFRMPFFILSARQARRLCKMYTPKPLTAVTYSGKAILAGSSSPTDTTLKIAATVIRLHDNKFSL